MPTIDSVTIHDFQSIKKAKVNFPSKESGGSVTTIVGPSSTGKSALLRALRMLMKNTSSAPVRIQEGANKTTVSADFQGTAVRVERGKSLSTYFIGTEKYSKAGTSVPQAVKDIMKLDEAEPWLHFTDQFSKPYLLDESGTTVSSLIGRLTHANTLRLAVKEGNRRSLESSRLLKTRLADLEKARENLTDYSWVDTSISNISECNTLISKYKKLNNKLLAVHASSEDYHIAQQKYTEASQKAVDHPDIAPEVEEASSLLQRCTETYSVLSLIGDKKYFAAKLLKNPPKTVDTEEVDLLQLHYDKIVLVKSLVQKVSSEANKCRELTESTNSMKKAAADVEEVHARTLRDAGRCPTCGQSTCS